jgi:anti-anti-sigma regulatory factor
MASNTNWSIDIQAAIDRLDGTQEEIVLDLSGLRRVDSTTLARLEQLSVKAKEHSVRIRVRGASIEIYKVLKLVAVAPGFSYDE